jgi:IMP dehydrogenase
VNPQNDELFDRYDALTFDDVVIVPGYSETLPDAVDTSAVFARDIELSVPLVSAAMDKVTEGRMAIAMARHGGIGVIHRNMPIEVQAAEVQKVKRSQSGMISDPVTLAKDAKLFEAEELMSRFKFSGVPITNETGHLVGILTNRDIRFCEGSDFERPISDFMTSERLVTAEVGTSLDEAKLLLHENRIEKLPLVDEDGRLAGLITVKDIQKRLDYPNASRDDRGRLRCAAAVGVGDDVEDRVEALVAMGVDAVAIDTAHGHSAGVIKAIERIKGSWPELAVTAGNVVTEEGVEALAEAGADAIKIGVGAGSICTTRIISGAGMPQLSAIAFTAKRARELGVPIIADGGITYSGDIVKAIAAGATTVMLGSLLAGTEESPGETELFEGRRFKSYRGMGSMGAMQGLGADRYATAQSDADRSADAASNLAQTSNKLVPEGIEGRVPYAGPLSETVYQLVGGLRSGMGYAGAANLEALRTGARFMRVSTAGREESHPHDVTITKEAPNYQRS